jgi:protein SCO1/2
MSGLVDTVIVRRFLRTAAVSLALAVTLPVSAEPVTPPNRTEEKPKRLQGVDVEERLDQTLPLDVPFKDEDGKPVVLRQYFDGKLPVIVTLNYSNCPMLCNLMLNGLTDGMKKVDATPGKDFRIVTINIDPNETPEGAKKFKQRYLTQYGRPEAASGWHFLTGSERDIRMVANAVGFHYNYNEARNEYVHPSAIALATPEGRIARYLYGIEYQEKTLRLSLIEASEGKIGSSIDRLVLYCFHYDSSEGRYAPVARNIMKVGGAVSVVLLAGFLGMLWLAELKKKKHPKGLRPQAQES